LFPVCYPKYNPEDTQNTNSACILYGCENLWHILREEVRLRVFDNRVLRRIFELKMEEVTGVWRKFYNEDLNDLYC
jgi:hypothetical protein